MKSSFIDNNRLVPPFSLAGRTAIVFGAGCVGEGWGNGKAAAVAYARAGAKVACVDLIRERAENTASIIRGEGFEAIGIRADVADSGLVKEAIAAVVAQWQHLDIVHNNPALAPHGGAVDLDEATWDRCFSVNVKSVFLACKHAIPIMQRQGRGVITNISSVLSMRVSDYSLDAYNASKAAVDQLTRSVAVRHARDGIRCNAVLPGLMNTPQIHAHGDIVALHGGSDETNRQRDAMSPSGRQGTGWDIAWTSVFLATDAAQYINGVALPVDAGLINRQATRPLHID